MHNWVTRHSITPGMMKILREPVYFLGQVQFKVKSGLIRVNGRIIGESEEWHSAYSPKSTALLAFKPELEDEVEIEFRPLENGLEAIQTCQPTFGNIFAPEPEIIEAFEELVKGFWLLKKEAEESCGLPLMRISGEWTEVLEDLKTSPKPAVVFVCGHRKVGKSSFSRFLMNGLLNEGGGEVEFVDLDPGQTEFTPAGFIARKSFNNKGTSEFVY